MNPIVRLTGDQPGERYSDPVTGFRCGVEIRRGAMSTAAQAEGHTLLVVAAGRATVLISNERISLSAGDAVTLPWRTKYVWEQADDTVTYYARQHEPGLVAGEEDQFSTIYPAAIGELSYCAPPARELLVGPDPDQLVKRTYLDTTGRWSTGYWSSNAYYRITCPFPKHEFMMLLSGSLSLTRPGEPTEVFSAGEALVLPKGTVCDWSTPGMSKIYCSLVETTPAQPADPEKHV